MRALTLGRRLPTWLAATLVIALGIAVAFAVRYGVHDHAVTAMHFHGHHLRRLADGMHFHGRHIALTMYHHGHKVAHGVVEAVKACMYHHGVPDC